VRPRPTLSRSLVLERSWPVLIDLGVLAAGLAVFFALFKVAHYWMGQPMPAVEISESVRALPDYDFY
jgi:NitT/TauT family transport system permease protein